MQTRQQARSESQSSTLRDSDSKNPHKKRPFSNGAVKPPKIQKNAELNLSFSNDELDMTQRTVNVEEISGDSDQDHEMTGISSQIN